MSGGTELIATQLAKVIVPIGQSGKALIVGGTRGIGAALVERLLFYGWEVTATGRKDFDIGIPGTWLLWWSRQPKNIEYDLVVFCAGELVPQAWSEKTLDDYLRAYAIHAAGPLVFLGQNKQHFPWWTTVVFLSTVGATNAGVVDLSYSCGKIALHKAAKALREHESWNVVLVELDLVRTGMLALLPVDTLHGRPIMEPEEAAELILDRAGVRPFIP